MQYRVAARVSVEKKGDLIAKVIKLDSETPLTAQQIEEQCFAQLAVDANKYTKKIL